MTMSSSPAAGHSDPRSLRVTHSPAPLKRPRHSSVPPVPVVRPLSSVPPPPARRPAPASSAAPEARRPAPDRPTWPRRAAAARVFGRPPALLLGTGLIVAAACFGLRDNLGGSGPFGLSDEAGAFVLDLGVPPPVLDGVFAFVNAAAAVVIFGLYLLIAACALEGRPWARVVGAAAAFPAAAAACAAHSGAQLFAVLLAGLGVALLFTQQVSLWLADLAERSRADAAAARAFLDQAAERYDESEEHQEPDGSDAAGPPGALGPVSEAEPAAEAAATVDAGPPAGPPVGQQADRSTRNTAGSPGAGNVWLRRGPSRRLARVLNLVRPSHGRADLPMLPAAGPDPVGAGVPGTPMETGSGAVRTAAAGLKNGADAGRPDAAGGSDAAAESDMAAGLDAAAGERADVHAGIGGTGTPASGPVRLDSARRRTVNGLLARRRRR